QVTVFEPLKSWIRLYVNPDNQIAGYARVRHLALAAHLKCHPILHSRRYFQLDPLDLSRPAFPFAIAAWPLDYLTTALTGPARLQRYKGGKPILAVDAPGLSLAIAHSTLAQFCARRRATAAALSAPAHPRHVDLFLSAAKHVLKRELHVVNNVSPLATSAKAKQVFAKETAAPSAASKKLLKYISEPPKAHVAEYLVEVRFIAAEHFFLTNVTVCVIALALLVVREHSISFGYLFELFFSCLVLVPVRVVLQRQLAICILYLFLASALLQS